MPSEKHTSAINRIKEFFVIRGWKCKKEVLTIREDGNLLNNKNLMSKLGENARKRVVAEHNWQNRARLIIERLNLISSS